MTMYSSFVQVMSITVKGTAKGVEKLTVRYMVIYMAYGKFTVRCMVRITIKGTVKGMVSIIVRGTVRGMVKITVKSTVKGMVRIAVTGTVKGMVRIIVTGYGDKSSYVYSENYSYYREQLWIS